MIETIYKELTQLKLYVMRDEFKSLRPLPAREFFHLKNL